MLSVPKANSVLSHFRPSTQMISPICSAPRSPMSSRWHSMPSPSTFPDSAQRAEDWVSRGLDYLGNAQECPFCGKSVSGSVLISHYREYFSESYTAHKRRISETRDRLASDFGGDRLAALQRLVQEEREKREFWSRYFETPGFGLELDRLADAWHKLSHGVLDALDRKAAAPLEPVSFDKSARHAVARYRQIAEEVRILSASLVGQNAAVKKAKAHSSEGNAVTAQVRLEHLQAIQHRYQPEVDAACKDYLAAKGEKDQSGAGEGPLPYRAGQPPQLRLWHFGGCDQPAPRNLQCGLHARQAPTLRCARSSKLELWHSYQQPRCAPDRVLALRSLVQNRSQLGGPQHARARLLLRLPGAARSPRHHSPLLTTRSQASTKLVPLRPLRKSANSRESAGN